MTGFELTYEEGTHSVEYLPGRFYVCNALDKYACIDLAQTLADEEGEGSEVGGPFEDDTGLVIDIHKSPIDWGLIAMMCAGVLFIASLERG